MTLATIIQQARQSMNKDHGQLDIGLYEMLRVSPAPVNDPPQLPEDLAAESITASFDGFVTRWANVEKNKLASILFEVDFDLSAAAELELCFDLSNQVGQDGVQVLPALRTRLTSIDANGRLLTHPEIIVFQQANYTAFLDGTVLRGFTPPFVVSDMHWLRVKARLLNPAGSPTLKLWKMGGQGV